LSGLANANHWALNIPGLAENYHVFAPDRLAAGATQNPDPPEAENFTYPAEAAHIIAFLDEVADGDDEIHLAGHSRGGGLAGVVAAEIPDRLSTLTIVSSGTLAPEWFDSGWRRYQIQGDWDRFEIGERSEYGPEEEFRYSIRKLSYNIEQVTEEFVESSVFLNSRQKVQVTDENADPELYDESVAQAVQGVFERIRSGELKKPILLHWGADDPVTAPFQSGIGLYGIIGSSNAWTRFKSINQAGHLFFREYPTEFNHQLSSFIEFWTDVVDRSEREPGYDPVQDPDPIE
jgi:pimeloyl-ACP methyl ester carboxylesterase